MLLKDLIVLGRACPEPMRDGRVTVCLAGWSESHGFIRLYPTRHDSRCKQWDRIEVDVEYNERDTRLESRKIIGSKDEWDTLASKIRVVGHVDRPDERKYFLHNLRDISVDFIRSSFKN